jgi:hypothetical protein
MGATFPLAMSSLRKSGGKGGGRTFSYLYLANVIGAGSGTLISAFVLIELFGFRARWPSPPRSTCSWRPALWR